MHPHPIREKVRHPARRVPARGYPRPENLARTYDATDLDRAVQAYRFFYPTVSGMAILAGVARVGARANGVFALFEAQPKHVGFTYDSDAPIGFAPLDLTSSPVVVEVPPGPLVVVATDVHQRWIADMGHYGPDAGQGGKHLVLAPDSGSEVPSGFHVSRSSSMRALLPVRSFGQGSPIGRQDVKAALEQARSIRVRPLVPPPDWSEPRWLDVTAHAHDTTPRAWESGLEYWKVLHAVVDSEPAFDGYGAYYGELAALGIAKGRPFSPDTRLGRLLEEAAQLGKAEMCAQSFADRRPDRIAWRDRRWEWAALRHEGGDFMIDGHLDLEARDKWFYQAAGASPAAFRRDAGAAVASWLGTHDRSGTYLDGGRTYALRVPRPVPTRFFWSVTVYDAETRSQIQTEQGRAALRSHHELASSEEDGSEELTLSFGPAPPDDGPERWIQTIPGRGWFAYLRVYAPEATAFDGTWKPGDFTIA